MEQKTKVNKEPELKTAHILFMDIVGYSTLKSDQQAGTITTLNQIVRAYLLVKYLQRQKRREYHGAE